MWTDECRDLVRAAIDDVDKDNAAAAALLVKAFRLDQQEDPSPEGFKVGTVAIQLWMGEGQVVDALSLLMDLKAMTTAIEGRLSSAHLTPLHWCDVNLRHDWLIACDGLDDALDALLNSARFTVKGELASAHFATARIKSSRGLIEAALQHLTEAWAYHQPSNSEYGHRHRICFHAAECCLRLGRIEDADRWMGEMEFCDEESETTCSAWRRQKQEYALLKALVTGDLWTATTHATALTDCDGVALNLLRARAYMADPDLGDPAERTHPARAPLSSRGNHESPHDRFARRLAIADMRVHELFHALGIARPVLLWKAAAFDSRWDEWPPEARRRAERTRRAIAAAARAGRRLDNALGTNWHVQQATDRLRQIPLPEVGRRYGRCLAERVVEPPALIEIG